MAWTRAWSTAAGALALVGGFLAGEPEARADGGAVVVGAQGSGSASARGGINFAGLGLGLVLSGFVAGGAGFAILIACRPSKPCHSDGLTTLGWVLAAPGIPPIVIGGFMIWADTRSPSGRSVTRNTPKLPLTISAMPVRSGGMVSASLTF